MPRWVKLALRLDGDDNDRWWRAVAIPTKPVMHGSSRPPRIVPKLAPLQVLSKNGWILLFGVVNPVRAVGPYHSVVDISREARALDQQSFRWFATSWTTPGVVRGAGNLLQSAPATLA